MEFTEKKAPANPAANQGRAIDKDLDHTINAFVDVGRSMQHVGSTFVTTVRRMATDEPLATLAFVAGTGFLVGAVWKSLR